MKTIYLAAARALNGGISLLIVFVLSNYFTPAEYGHFGLIHSAYVTISTFCFFWLGAYLFRFPDVSQTRASLLQLVLISGLIMTCIVLVLAIFGVAPTYGDGIIIALGATALGGFSAVQEFLAGRQYYRQYFLTSGVRFGLAAALVFLALMYLRDPMALMLALIFALAVPAVIMFAIHGAGATLETRGHMGRIEANQMASVLRYSAPFVAINLTNAVINVADRVVIGQVLDLKSVGLYVGAQDLTMQIIGASAGVLLLRITAPSMRDFDGHGMSRAVARAFMRRMALAGIGFAGLIAACLVLAPQTYLLLLAPEAQRAAQNFYVLMTMGGGVFFLTTLIFHTVLMIEKRTHIMASASLIVLFTNVAGNLVLVPGYGLTGAAAALLVSSLLGLAYSAFMTRKFWRSVIVTAFATGQ
jgi:O-antigen/teichoic acid export membrane protein